MLSSCRTVALDDTAEMAITRSTRDMVRGSPLGPVRRVQAGERAAALGARHADVQDQVGVAAQHADQYGVDAGQHARLGPARQALARRQRTVTP